MSCCNDRRENDSPGVTQAGHVETRARSARWTLGGSVTAAVLSSACCWLPLLLLAFGASAAGVSNFFERWRPVFLVVAIALLAAGFAVVSVRSPACAGRACERVGRRRHVFNQVMLWTAVALVAAFATFPRYAGVIARSMYGTQQADESAPAGAQTALHGFSIEGMTCEACATTLEADLVKIPEFTSARVDFATRSAEVRSDASDAVAVVQAVAARHGYRATPR